MRITSHGLKITFISLTVAFFVYLFLVFDVPYTKNPTDFTTCVAFGKLVMESYPRQCISKDGIVYTEQIKQASSTIY